MTKIFLCGKCSFIGTEDELLPFEADNSLEAIAEDVKILLSKQPWTCPACPQCYSNVLFYKTNSLKQTVVPSSWSKNTVNPPQEAKIKIENNMDNSNNSNTAANSEGQAIHGLTPDQLKDLQNFQLQNKKIQQVNRSSKFKAECQDCGNTFETKDRGGGFGVRCKKCLMKMSRRRG